MFVKTLVLIRKYDHDIHTTKLSFPPSVHLTPIKITIHFKKITEEISDEIKSYKVGANLTSSDSCTFRKKFIANP